MRQLAAVIAILSLLCVFSSPCFAQPKQELRISTSIKPPLSTKKQDGYLDALIQELLKRMDYSAQIIRLPAERALYNANRGQTDIELVRIAGIEKNYPNLIRVPEPIITYDFTAFSLLPIDDVSDWDKLRFRSVAYIIGWKIFEKNIPAEAEAAMLPTAEQLFKTLQQRHAEVVLHEKHLGSYVAQEQGIDPIHISPPLARRIMYMYVHNSRKELVPLLEKTLKEIKQDGTLLELAKQKLSLDYIP